MQLYYVTFEDFYSEVPALVQEDTTNDGTLYGGQIRKTVETKLKESENIVDSYLNRRYSIPVKAKDGTVPEEIKGAVYVIAKYKLYARRNALSPEIQAQYDSTMRFLRDVGSGKAEIAVYEEDGTRDNNQDITLESGSQNQEWSTFF